MIDKKSKYYLITRIEGAKQYVRLFRRKDKTRVAITMLCMTPSKAYDFETLERATQVKDALGIGYAIEVWE